MNYHLNRQGQDLGIFPIEELRRCRGTGELNGTELVWREGMREWLPLDTVLGETARGQRGSMRVFLWLAVAAVCLGAVIGGGVFVMKMASRVVPGFSEILQGGSGNGLEAARKPVSWTPHTLTERDMQKERKAFRVRQWLEGYDEGGNHSTPCDADARQFIETWIARNYGGEVPTNLPSTEAWTDRLAADPDCNDPLVLTVAGIAGIEGHENIHRLERAVEGFKGSRHKAYPQFCATIYLANDVGQAFGDQKRVQPLQNAALPLLQTALADGSVRPEDQEEMAEILINNWGYTFFYQHRQQVCQIAGNAGKPFEWLALVLRGECSICDAWAARGSGYANTITPAGWQGFATNLAVARQCLTKAWKLRPDLPIAPERMIYVSLGDSDVDEMRVWFDRTTGAQLDNSRAWSDLRWGLRPRWYGSPEAMLALGVTAVNTKRFDTDVPRKFMDVVSDLESELDLGPGETIYGREDIWPHVKEMYDGYIAEPSRVSERDGWRTLYAAVAYLAGKYDVARSQLEAVNWAPWPNWLTGWDLDLSLMPLEVAARTGPAGPQIAEAEAARKNGQVAQALLLYTNVLSSPGLDDKTARFARIRVASLDLERRLQSGGWVDFLPATKDDSGWAFPRGKAQLLSDGALEVQSDAWGHFLYSYARLGTNFEVKGEFEVVSSSTGHFQGGVVFGLPDLNAYTWYAFRIKRNQNEGDVAVFARGWIPPELKQSTALDDHRNTFDLIYQGGCVTASVNDRTVFSQAKPPQSIRIRGEDLVLGLGAYNDLNQTVLRYRHVQVRKL